MKALAILLALAGSVSAQAMCIGSGAFRTCDDERGGNYSAQRNGSSTYYQGRRSDGTSWQGNGQDVGNSTIYNGTTSDGRHWSGSSQRIGETTIYNGTDSRDNVYQRTCTQYGCY